MGDPLGLIIGIGNPGARYARTRHNVGIWFVEKLAVKSGGVFREEKKFNGRVCTIDFHGRELKLLIPTTYMNASGKSVGSLVNFYKVPHQKILIAHDELDLATGIIRFKQGGGLAGHKGLRDISRCLGGSQEFNRLRIGVGHPGVKEAVTGHVLGIVTPDDKEMVDKCINEALVVLPLAVEGEWQQAMNQLHKPLPSPVSKPLKDGEP